MALRKVLLNSGSEADNAASFVNQTARRLHIRKIVLRIEDSGASSIGEASGLSLDEVPVRQSNINDSRSHIGGQIFTVEGGTGAVAGKGTQLVLSFNRNDLVLDSDEALFMNTFTVVGPPVVSYSTNIWYED